jgi:hypothetical protein
MQRQGEEAMNTKWGIFHLGLAIVSLSVETARASVDKEPALTAATARGIWEAVGSPDIRVFRLVVSSNRVACIAFATAPADDESDASTFSADTIEVNRGKLRILFRDGSSDYTLRLSGRGVAGESNGVISAKLTLSGPKAKPTRTTWNVTFIKCDELNQGSYGDVLSRLFHFAKRATVKATPPKTGTERQQSQAR